MRKFLVPFLFLAACWTVVAAFVAISVQQNYRLSANDPQIQDVEDVITAINQGQQLSLQPDGTDIATSLSTFIVLYDAKGVVLGSNVTLNGSMPQIPANVFSYVDKHGEDRFTWQPVKNNAAERYAVVVGKASSADQYVAVGRSLREVAQREHELYGITAVAWTLLILISLLGCYWIFEGCPCMDCRRKRANGELGESVICEACGHQHMHAHIHMHDGHHKSHEAETKEDHKE